MDAGADVAADVAADTTPPTVISTSPPNATLNVAVGATLTATLSEALDPSTVTAATFTLTNGGMPVAGVVTSAGTTATFAPSSALPLDGSFVATVSTGVTDLAGNALAADYTWAFTTPSRPTVIATSPVDGTQGVSINRNLTATGGPLSPTERRAADEALDAPKRRKRRAA